MDYRVTAHNSHNCDKNTKGELYMETIEYKELQFNLWGFNSPPLCGG
jgi:hypothetical protein